MDNQNIQKAGDSAKQIGQIGQAESIDFGSIRIEKNANGSAIISGNDNRVVIYQYQIERQVEEDLSARVGEIGPNPYKGLLAFQETDGDRFFGRDKQIEQLWNNFRTLHEGDSTIRLLPIYGPSGSGKSSLARAGLIPELARRPLPRYAAARVAVLVPGTHPLEALASVLARVATNDPAPVAKTREFAEELEKVNKQGDYDGLRRIADVLPDIAFSPLIVLVDQFEEVYSLCEKQEERDTFIGNLLTGASSRSRHVSVIVTLRSDFLGETQKHPVLNRLFAKQGFLLPTMDDEELRQAIRQPAEIAGHPLDNATIELLIKDTEGREGALPLLQFTLTRIWEGLADGKEPAETLKAIGGVGGALAGEAQRIYDTLSSVEEKDIARRVFLGLVQLGEGSKDTRRRTEIKKIVSHRDTPEQVKQVITRFSAPGARLITLAANANAETAELTHEALFDHWQLLNDWLDSSRSEIRFGRRLDEAAVHWDENDRPEGNLWRPPDLNLLRRYYQRASEDMTPLQVEFFNASLDAENARKQAAEKAQKERKQQRQLWFGVLSIGLILTTSLAGFAIYQLQQVQRKQVEQLAATAEAQLESQPIEAQVNAIAGFGLDRSAFVKFPNHPLSASIQDSLLDVIQVNKEQNQFQHTDTVVSVAFSPDGKQIVSGGWDNNVRLWGARTGKPIGQPFTGHKKWVSSVAFSPDGKQIISGSNDKTLRLWDVRTGNPIGQPFTGHTDGVRFVAFSPDGKQIISGSEDKTVRLWDVRTGKPIGQPFTGHTDKVESVAFSPDGKQIISGSNDKTLRLWDVRTGKPIGQPFTGHTDAVISVAFSPDGKQIISGSQDKTVRLWDARTGTPIRQPFTGHTDAVYSVAFSPDGKQIISGSNDKTVRLWDARTGNPIGKPFTGHRSFVYSVTFSPDGKQIVSGSYDSTVRLWDARTGNPIGKPFTGYTDAVLSVAFSPDGKQIVSGSYGKTVNLWDARTGNPIRQPFTGHTNWVLSVAFSHDGKQIVSGSQDKTVRLWDAHTGNPIRQPFTGHTDAVRSVAFSPDGKQIVSGSQDKTVRLWDARTGNPIRQPFTGHTDAVISVAFSPDGKQIVSGSQDKTVRLWDARTGNPIGKPFTGHTEGLYSVALSPDGKQIVTGSYDNTVRLWDAPTGNPIGKPFRGHTRAVYSVAFSPDGKQIVSGSYDNTVRLWDARTGNPIGKPLTGHTDVVSSVAFSPDGKQIVSGSWDKTVRLWNVSWESWLQTACNQLRYHSLLLNPTTDEAKEAKKTCQQYVWH
jgi:WD40 repeat protein